jgi:hypothetical protein
MNYGEELVYWYLRLNGLFPIANFVIHKSTTVKHSSDCDLLALRSPYVYEEIGGQPSDWDAELADLLGFSEKRAGVICEVKTGDYSLNDLFPRAHVEYAIGRLGLLPRDEIPAVAEALEKGGCIEHDDVRICKLLVTNRDKVKGSFLFRSIAEIEEFIVGRVKKYPKEKFADRMFFPSELFQYLIDRVNRERVLAKPKKTAI